MFLPTSRIPSRSVGISGILRTFLLAFALVVAGLPVVEAADVPAQFIEGLRLPLQRSGSKWIEGMLLADRATVSNRCITAEGNITVYMMTQDGLTNRVALADRVIMTNDCVTTEGNLTVYMIADTGQTNRIAKADHAVLTNGCVTADGNLTVYLVSEEGFTNGIATADHVWATTNNVITAAGNLNFYMIAKNGLTNEIVKADTCRMTDDETVTAYGDLIIYMISNEGKVTGVDNAEKGIFNMKEMSGFCEGPVSLEKDGNSLRGRNMRWNSNSNVFKIDSNAVLVIENRDKQTPRRPK